MKIIKNILAFPFALIAVLSVIVTLVFLGIVSWIEGKDNFERGNWADEHEGP